MLFLSRGQGANRCELCIMPNRSVPFHPFPSAPQALLSGPRNTTGHYCTVLYQLLRHVAELAPLDWMSSNCSGWTWIRLPSSHECPDLGLCVLQPHTAAAETCVPACTGQRADAPVRSQCRSTRDLERCRPIRDLQDPTPPVLILAWCCR